MASPPGVIERYASINHPPIYKHQIVTEEMIGPEMLELISKKGSKVKPDKQLTLAFHAKDILLTTDFVLYYVERGLKIGNVTMVVEFEKDTPLKQYVNNATAERVKATVDGNACRGNIAKLVVNSGYGKTNENTNRHCNCQLMPKDKEAKNKFVIETNNVIGEVDSGYVEVLSRKRRIKNVVPGKLFHLLIFSISQIKIQYTIPSSSLHGRSCSC